MSFERPLRWGVISTSSTAAGKAIPALLRCANANLVAVASRDLAKASACAARFAIPRAYGTYEALLQDPGIDAVYLPLPNSLHGEWTSRAAQAGKHVLCEKPAAVDPSTAERMVAICAEAGVLFQEGFMYRFHPQFAVVRGWLEKGRIGQLRLIRISFSFPLESRHSRIRLQASLDGGALADVGSYGIDLACWLMGRQPNRAFAVGSREYGADVETGFTAVLEVPGGPHVALDGGFDRPRQGRCEIVGSAGSILIASPFFSAVEAEVLLAIDTSPECCRLPPEDLFQLQFEHFSACALTGAEPAISADETLRTARVLAALRESLTTGTPIEVSHCAAPGAASTIEPKESYAKRIGHTK